MFIDNVPTVRHADVCFNERILYILSIPAEPVLLVHNATYIAMSQSPLRSIHHILTSSASPTVAIMVFLPFCFILPFAVFSVLTTPSVLAAPTGNHLAIQSHRRSVVLHTTSYRFSGATQPTHHSPRLALSRSFHNRRRPTVVYSNRPGYGHPRGRGHVNGHPHRHSHFRHHDHRTHTVFDSRRSHFRHRPEVLGPLQFSSGVVSAAPNAIQQQIIPLMPEVFSPSPSPLVTVLSPPSPLILPAPSPSMSVLPSPSSTNVEQGCNEGKNLVCLIASALLPKVIGVVRLSGQNVSTHGNCEVTVNLAIIGMKPGEYVVRIHEFGDRRAPDGSSVGAVYGEMFTRKEAAGMDVQEKGVLGVLTANEEGVLKMKWTVTNLELALVLGRSVVVEQRTVTDEPAGIGLAPNCVLGIANPEVVRRESRWGRRHLARVRIVTADTYALQIFWDKHWLVFLSLPIPILCPRM